jgi:phospholipid/cholesterol/gamma-HCH transport system substrate-binding protein
MNCAVSKKMVVFVALTLGATMTMMFGLTHVPRMLGIGQTTLTTYLPATLTVYVRAGGGLHRDSTVTDHGVVIGKITAVNPSPEGLQVDLSVDDSVKIGADATATIQHASPAGEVSLELASHQPGGPYLPDNAVIPTAAIAGPDLGPPMLENVTD